MKRKVITGFIVCAIAFSVFIAANRTARRAITNIYPNPQTYKVFPERRVETSPNLSELKRSDVQNFPLTLSYETAKGVRTEIIPETLKKTKTDAFIVIKNNSIIYEKYLNGTDRKTIHTSFSLAKSFLSTLIGIAIDEGKIGSVNDPVIKYIPELKDRGIDLLTIRDLLMMSTGIDYKRIEETFFLFIPFSPDIKTFYGDDLRKTVLSLKSGENPIGKYFNYNDYYPVLEGIILERVTGMSISEYTSMKLWKRMGMESDASWSLDSTENGMERVFVGLNARPLDFARFGLLFLNGGIWNGHKIISRNWIEIATSPDPEDTREWMIFKLWPKYGGYYKYHWWGLKNKDNTYDYFASGNLGQIIYVSPASKTVVVRLGGQAGEMFQWPFFIRELIRQIR